MSATSPPTVATSLRFASDLVRGLPGIAPVSVTVWSTGAVSIQVVNQESRDGASEHARGATVDMLAAVLGLTPQQTTTFDDSPCYGAKGTVAGIEVDIYAPGVEVVRPEQVSA